MQVISSLTFLLRRVAVMRIYSSSD